jgi:tRNA(Ile)-lysidine synthase
MIFTPSALSELLPVDSSVSRLWVAFSGGLDSTVLLHALASLKLATPVLALHVNHQISPYANAWQEQCAASCRALQVEFHTETVALDICGRGVEDAAREARYAVFERYLKAGDLLLMAHHADDQAETVLLRLLRGAGPRGLAAMAQKRALGAGQLYRPLLNFTRAELHAYASSQQLCWIDDESNFDTHYDRNFLRQKVIPLLQNRWPTLPRQLQQTARLCADTEQLLVEFAAADLAQSDTRVERLGQSISLAALEQFSSARRHNVLRHWLRLQELDIPEQQHLVQFEQQLVNSRADAEAVVEWGETKLQTYRSRLYAMPRARAKYPLKPQQIALSGQTSEILLPGNGHLQFVCQESSQSSSLLRTDLENLTVRWRQGGERCQPAGRAHSQTLKRLLQEYGLEPWWREQLPLIYCGDSLAAVGDLWVCTDFLAPAGTSGYSLVWQPGIN